MEYLPLSLVLLRRMQDGIETIEKGSVIGMLSLAVSDFLFCLVTLVQTFIDNSVIFYSRDISLFITLYGNFLQNIFIKTSTTITVLMALFRFLALVKPYIMARNILRIYKLKEYCLIWTFVIWIVLYLPLLWMWETHDIECSNG